MKEWNDNIKNKITQHEFDFSDQAWEKMDTLLGEPDNTKEKPIAFFNSKALWISVGLILIIGSSWFLFFNNFNYEKGQTNNIEVIAKNETNSQIATTNQQIPSTVKQINQNISNSTFQIQKQTPILADSFIEEKIISIDTITPKINQPQPLITNHQSPITDNQLINHFYKYNKHHQPEKTYIHTDRTMYKPGESIWFSVYVRDALTLAPSTKSSVVYVEWISPKGTVEKKLQLFAKDGIAIGDVLIDKNFNGGIYQLKAYTNWQKNSNHQGISSFTKEITVQKAVIPNLRMKLDFAREAYGSSDEVVADLELKNMEDAPLSNHEFSFKVNLEGTAHYEGEGTTDEIGRAKVTFNLPENLTTNDGLLNIVITYNGQAESISRPIPIVLNTIDLQFLPESGQILAGMTNKIAFKAINEFGKTADVSGLIFNSKGDTISSFSSYHQGMGAVSFEAKQDESYTAKITQPKGIDTIYELPQAIDDGYAIHVAEQNDSACIIEIKSNNLEQIQLLATAGDKVHFYKNIKNRTTYIDTINISTQEMPIGIATLTLVNVRNQPLAERLIFVNRYKQLNIEVKSNKQKYTPREKAEISITVKDNDEQPIKGNFSLSVVDDKQLSFTDDRQTNILSQLLLQSELKGKVEEPNFYFDSPKKHSDKDQGIALDYLMLTQGWRKFEWLDSIGQPFALQQYQAEDMTISGYVMDINNEPLEGVTVNLKSLNHMTTTNKNGFFTYQHNDFISSTVQGFVQYGSITKSISLNQTTIDTFQLIVDPYKNLPTNNGDELIFAVKKKVNKRSSIVGKIINHITNEPFKFATVALYKGNMLVSGTYSDPHGNFDMQSIGAGNYTLKISHVGYSQLIAALIVKHDELVSLNVRLKEGINLPRVDIVSHMPPRERLEYTTSSTKVTGQNITRIPSKKEQRQQRKRQKEEERRRLLEQEALQQRQREETLAKQREAEKQLTQLIEQQKQMALNRSDLKEEDKKAISSELDKEITTNRVSNINADAEISIPPAPSLLQQLEEQAMIKRQNFPRFNSDGSAIILDNKYLNDLSRNQLEKITTINGIDFLPVSGGFWKIIPTEIDSDFPVVHQKNINKSNIKNDPPKRKIKDEPLNTFNKNGVLRIIDKNLHKEYETLEFDFYPVTERILVNKPSTKIEVIPAEYETVTETVLAKAASKKLVTVPAEYETVVETIEISPATTKWVKRKSDRNCLSADPKDCQVWCLIEVPARHETIKKTVLKTPATTKEVDVPAEYQTVTKRVVTKPATTRTIQVPAQYKTVNGFAIKNKQATSELVKETPLDNFANQYYRQNSILNKDTIATIFNFDDTKAYFKYQIIYVIDGKKMPYQQAKRFLKEIHPDSIANIDILQGTNALNIFNGSPTRGAIYVNTKSGQKTAFNQLAKDYNKILSHVDDNYASLENKYNELLVHLNNPDFSGNLDYLSREVNGFQGNMNRIKSTLQIYGQLLEVEAEMDYNWEDLHSGAYYAHRNAQNFKNGRYRVRKFYAPKYESKPSDNDQPLVRNDFRTTVYWNGNIQTDENGQAAIEFYNSDAITTFRATIEGLGNDGSIGRSEHTYYTQLPFGMLTKAPTVAVTGDIIKLPITLMNNTNQAIEGNLKINAPNGFELISPLDENIVLQSYERITIYPSYKMTYQAQDGNFNIEFNSNGLNDAFSQPIKVKKRGYPKSILWSNNEPKGEFNFNLDNPIEGSIEAFFNVYPTTFGDLVETSKRMLRQPYGCFEQTSSVNYPNLLVLDLLNSTKMNDLKTRREALEYLQAGYKRLKGFEVETGGFDWYGKGPAHEGLTAYGLMQFVDMKSVYPVSQKMIDRTASWLLSRRDGNGSWKTNSRRSFGNGTHTGDAYIVWALCEAGYGKFITKEIDKSYNDALKTKDAYMLALVSNALLKIKDNRAYILLDELKTMQAQDGSFVNNRLTFMHSYSSAGSISTTALASLAFVKALNQGEGFDATLKTQLDKAISFLLASRSKYGFGNTQSTVLTLKALIENTKSFPVQQSSGTVALTVNENEIGVKIISDKQAQNIIFDNFENILQNGQNTSKVNIKGVSERLNYDMAINYTAIMPDNSPECLVRLKTELNTNTVKMGETVRLTTTLSKVTDQAVPNPIAIIGLPSGLSLQHWQLKDMQEQGVFDYYELMDGYLVLHFIEMEAENTKNIIHFDLKADIPGQYEAPASSAYLYYTVEHQQWTAPLKIEIKE